MWFGKKTPLWTTDSEGRRHLTEDGKRQFSQWEAEGKLRRADCQVHVLDPAQAGERIETWPIDAGDDGVDRETFNRLRDNRGHLHALVHYKAGIREVYVVAKPIWDQALEAFN